MADVARLIDRPHEWRFVTNYGVIKAGKRMSAYLSSASPEQIDDVEKYVERTVRRFWTEGKTIDVIER